MFDVLGAGIIRALVAVRAGLIIAAAALLALAIAAANESRALDDPLKTLFYRNRDALRQCGCCRGFPVPN